MGSSFLPNLIFVFLLKVMPTGVGVLIHDALLLDFVYFLVTHCFLQEATDCFDLFKTEAKYHALSITSKELVWIVALLKEFGVNGVVEKNLVQPYRLDIYRTF